MGKTFDELYGEFFNKNNKQPIKRKRKTKTDIEDMLTDPIKLGE
jgi:hypothetical protein